jgi:hypothetical protein
VLDVCVVPVKAEVVPRGLYYISVVCIMPGDRRLWTTAPERGVGRPKARATYLVPNDCALREIGFFLSSVRATFEECAMS